MVKQGTRSGTYDRMARWYDAMQAPMDWLGGNRRRERVVRHARGRVLRSGSALASIGARWRLDDSDRPGHAYRHRIRLLWRARNVFHQRGGQDVHKETGPVTDEVLDQWIARLTADTSAVAGAQPDR
jgi:hypothetical protein